MKIKEMIENQEYDKVADWLSKDETRVVQFDIAMRELEKKLDRLELMSDLIDKMSDLSDAEFLLEYNRIEKTIDLDDEDDFWSNY